MIEADNQSKNIRLKLILNLLLKITKKKLCWSILNLISQHVIIKLLIETNKKIKIIVATFV